LLSRFVARASEARQAEKGRERREAPVVQRPPMRKRCLNEAAHKQRR
jgi:hypothetical protein